MFIDKWIYKSKKNWTEHFMKNSFVDDPNDLYNQCLLFNFRVKIAVFYEQTLYLTTLKEML